MSKRGHYGKWSEKDLVLALAAYKNGECGLNECSRVYGVPKATIKRHADSGKEFKTLGRPPTFSGETERIILRHILNLEECFFGLTIKEVRKLAFDVAQEYKLPHNFNIIKKIAGKKWFYAFVKRNPHLSFQKPIRPSNLKPKCFNRENVNIFFDRMAEIINEHKLTARSIYTVDVSEFITTSNNIPFVNGRKRKHQAEDETECSTSFECDINTNTPIMVCACSAAGVYIPPMIIYKRAKFNDDLKVGGPVESIVTVSGSGFINLELFIEWLKHFQKHVNCNNEDNKVLLLLDGLTTHSKNFHVCEFARTNGIILLQLPRNNAHLLRPLDISFVQSLQNYFTEAQNEFLFSNNGDKTFERQITKLFNEAYGKAATVGVAEIAFRTTGIWPINRFIFSEDQFTTDDVFQPSVNLVESSSSDESDDNSISQDVKQFFAQLYCKATLET